MKGQGFINHWSTFMSREERFLFDSHFLRVPSRVLAQPPKRFTLRISLKCGFKVYLNTPVEEYRNNI